MLAASSISIFAVASGALAFALHSEYGSTGRPAEPVLLVQVRVSGASFQQGGRDEDS